MPPCIGIKHGVGQSTAPQQCLDIFSFILMVLSECILITNDTRANYLRVHPQYSSFYMPIKVNYQVLELKKDIQLLHVFSIFLPISIMEREWQVVGLWNGFQLYYQVFSIVL